MSFDLSSCLSNNPTFFSFFFFCVEMNTLMMQMRHTAHELRVTLNHVLQEREETLIQQTSQDETLSFSTPPEAEIREVHQLSEVGFFFPSLKFILITICSNLLNYNLLFETFFFPLQDNNNILFLAENLRIPRNLYEPIAEIADYKKYISALLMILFDRETLATHSLQGRRGAGDECHKPQLPPDILKGIIGKKKSTELFITLRRHRVENQTSVLFLLLLQTMCRPSLVWTAAK